MKKLIKTASFLIMLVLVGCSLEGVQSVPQPEDRFPLEEARAFFERTVQPSAAAPRKGGLSPGEFVPLWDDAKMKATDGTSRWYVPILPSRLVYSFDGDYRDAQVFKRRHRVEQELVLSKDGAEGEVQCSLRSRVYAPGRKSKARFNGLLVYTDVLKGTVLRAEKYKDGALVNEVRMTDRGMSLRDRRAKTKQIFSGYHFRSRPRVGGRSEEDFGDDWTEEDEQAWLEEYLGEVFGDNELPEFFDDIEIDLTQLGLEDYVYCKGVSYSYSTTHHFASSNPIMTFSPASTSIDNSDYLYSLHYILVSFGSSLSYQSVLSLYADCCGEPVENITSIDSRIAYSMLQVLSVSSEVSTRQGIRAAIDAGKVVFAYVRDEDWNRRSLCIVGYDSATNRLIHMCGEDGQLYIEDSYYPLYILTPRLAVSSLVL